MLEFCWKVTRLPPGIFRRFALRSPRSLTRQETGISGCVCTAETLENPVCTHLQPSGAGAMRAHWPRARLVDRREQGRGAGVLLESGHVEGSSTPSPFGDS